MPYSGTLLDGEAEKFFKYIASEVTTVLDVGAGAGKYGRMWNAISPEAEITGVEVYEPYFIQFKNEYRDFYKTVHLGDIIQALDEPEIKFDLVIFGDVLEHLPKSSGLDVLHFFTYRSKYIWSQFPRHYLQNPSDVQGNFYEAHISVWRPQDFDALDTEYAVWWNAPLWAIASRGYLPAKGLPEWAPQKA